MQARIPAKRRANAIGVYTYLAYHARQHKCSLEIRKLEEFLGCSESTIKRTLNHLVTEKIIGKKSRFAKHNGKRVCLANEYVLLDVERIEAKPAQHPPRKA